MQQINIIGDTCKDRRIDTKYIKTPDELRDIKGNYSLQRGIYLIDFEINVPNCCGLILEPGVEFYFTKDAGITCEGRFEGRGTNGLEVLLTAKNEEDGWKNIYLKGGAEAVLDYAKLSYGKGREDIEGYISGGALLLESKDELKPSIIINNSCFENNSSYYGGAIFIYQSDVEIKENNIFKNNSADCGGAVANYQGNITIKENNRFEKNSAEYKGGVIYNLHGDLTIEKDNRFEKNYAKWGGGAIRNYQGKLEIDESRNTFKNNMPDDISEE